MNESIYPLNDAGNDNPETDKQDYQTDKEAFQNLLMKFAISIINVPLEEIDIRIQEMMKIKSPVGVMDD